MNSIAENLKRIADSLPEGVKLVAVSKTKPVEAIEEAYNAGQRVFGENRAQELAEKYEVLPKDIEWHLIGHLQTNKVKYVAGFVAMIHGVESLLQFHVAKEETKFGLNMEEARELLESESYANMKNVRIEGVMGMATFTDDLVQVQEEFRHLKRIFNELKQQYFADKSEFKELSMGMSGDYKIAVEEGSTMVRVGSSIFGARQYKAIEN